MYPIWKYFTLYFSSSILFDSCSCLSSMRFCSFLRFDFDCFSSSNCFLVSCKSSWHFSSSLYVSWIIIQNMRWPITQDVFRFGIEVANNSKIFLPSLFRTIIVLHLCVIIILLLMLTFECVFVAQQIYVTLLQSFLIHAQNYEFLPKFFRAHSYILQLSLCVWYLKDKN